MLKHINFVSKLALTGVNLIFVICFLSLSIARSQSTTSEPPDECAVGTWQMVWGGQKHMGIQLMKGAFSAIPNLKWQFTNASAPTAGGGEGEPIVGDVNGDGKNEVIVSNPGGGKLFVIDGETGAQIFSVNNGGQGSPAIADVNGDGKIEIIANNTNALTVYNGTNGNLIWQQTMGSNGYSSVAVGDINGDGSLEIVISCLDASKTLIRAYAGSNGTKLWEYQTTTQFVNYFSSPALGDIDCDGIKEVACGSPSSYGTAPFCEVFVLKGNNGSKVWQYNFPGGGGTSFWSSCVLGDLNKDCSEDVVINGPDGKIHAIDGKTGNLLWNGSTGHFAATPVIADINGDNSLEVVCANGNNVFAVNNTGAQIWTAPITPKGAGNTGWFGSTPVLGDFDPASPGLESVVGVAYGSGVNDRIFMFSLSGTQLWNYYLPNHSYEGVSLADIDNDGCVEILGTPSCCEGTNTIIALDDVGNSSNCGAILPPLPTSTKNEFLPMDTISCTPCMRFRIAPNPCVQSYNWTFQSGTPATSNQQIPGQVCFNAGAGKYKVTLISMMQGMCIDTSVHYVTIKNCSPVVSLNNATICSGGCATLNATGLGGIAPYTYSWSPSAGLSATTGATVTACPVTTTTYIVTLTDNGGITATARGVITVNPLPPVTATGGTICLGASITITAGGATTYTWDNGLGTGNSKTVNPAITTTYNVTGTDGNTCTNTASCVVVVNPLPTITATGGTICMGQSIVISASGGTTYTWNNGLNTGNPKTVSPAITTTYLVTGADANGCTGTSSCVVVVNNNITPTVNSPTICLGAIATLTASGGDNYTWTPGGQTVPTITVTPPTTTTYFVSATNTFGCTGTVVATVTVNPLPNITATGGTICLNIPINISANGGTTYTWNTLSNSNPYNVNPGLTTTYTVTGTDNNTCTNTAQCVVIVNPLPNVGATGGIMCQGTSQVIVATGADFYTWNNGVNGSSQTVTPAATTTYCVTGVDLNGCTGTACCVVTVNNSFTLLVNNPTICNGGTTVLTASGGNNYTWYTTPNQMTPSITVSPAITTTYLVSGTNTVGCTGSNIATVTVNQLPNITATGGTICLNIPINISANGGTTYTWNTLSNSNPYNVNPNVT
ncbi:MAG: FG-GAP-like repeat-containing protein, partial [Bacteroidales bacterium]|nr:FG-GAP-like repeat-containing protein [Bacteroidales bacterium]